MLIDEGLSHEVVRKLMSGKEATVYVVRSGGETRCAKICKDASESSFRQAVDYTENRKLKNSHHSRAMAKGTKFGRQDVGADLKVGHGADNRVSHPQKSRSQKRRGGMAIGLAH